MVVCFFVVGLQLNMIDLLSSEFFFQFISASILLPEQVIPSLAVMQDTSAPY